MNSALLRQRTRVTDLAVLGAVVVIDQASKSATASWRCGRVICPLGNDGLALGIGGRPTLGVVFAGALGLLLLVGWARLTGAWSTSRRWVLVCVGGIASNLADRALTGGVRDFIAGPAGTVFNVADVAIALGLPACAIGVLRHRRSSASGAPTSIGGGDFA